MLLDQVREHSAALEFCVMALDVCAGVSRRALSSLLGWRKQEDRHSMGGLRFGSLQR